MHAAGNAWVTLQAGFTTVQSLGAPLDKEVRDLIGKGAIPGPRVLTSFRSINERTGEPAQIREFVRHLKSDGADAMNLFATASIRDDGAQTMTAEQVAAAIEHGDSAHR